MQLKPSFGVGNRNQGPIMDGYLIQNFLFQNSYTKSKSCGNEHMKEMFLFFNFSKTIRSSKGVSMSMLKSGNPHLVAHQLETHQ